MFVLQADIAAVGSMNAVKALTDILHAELQDLLKHFSFTIQYETLTQAARQAYDAGRWDDLRKVGAQRAALSYTPPSGFTVASGRARLESLRNKVEQRQQTHLDALHMPENIDYVVACNSCLDEVTSLELLKCPTWPQVPPVSHACIWYHSLTHRAYLCPRALCRPILQL